MSKVDEPVVIFASTSCVRALEPLEKRLSDWYERGIKGIELSYYPIKNTDRILDYLHSIPARIIIHNYFPPSAGSLVLNLASKNLEIRTKTRSFYEHAIMLSQSLGAPWYSLHGGFVTDPQEKGKWGFSFPQASEQDRREALELFIQEIDGLAAFAASRRVTLLVENNVSTKENRGSLLFSGPEDFRIMLSSVSHHRNIGILLDTGHLRVSACTFDFDFQEFFELDAHVMGIHLHDNDGLEDRHMPSRPGDWAFEFARQFHPKFVTTEGLYSNVEDLITGIAQLEASWNG